MKFIWANGKEKDVFVGTDLTYLKMTKEFYKKPVELFFSTEDIQWMMSLSDGLFWLRVSSLINVLAIRKGQEYTSLRLELAKLRRGDKDQDPVEKQKLKQVRNNWKRKEQEIENANRAKKQAEHFAELQSYLFTTSGTES